MTSGADRTRRGIGGEHGYDHKERNNCAEGVRTRVKTVLGCSFHTCCGRSERVEKIAHDAAAPAKLLFEKDRKRIGTVVQQSASVLMYVP